MTIIQEYVLGFRFDPTQNNDVILIEKLKPKWQLGKLNGIGGKIEGEDKHFPQIDYKTVAMIREFAEETGIETTDLEWQHTLMMCGSDWIVHVFKSFGDISTANTMEEEQVFICSTEVLPKNVLPNLKWIIPLLLDNEVRGTLKISY